MPSSSCQGVTRGTGYDWTAGGKINNSFMNKYITLIFLLFCSFRITSVDIKYQIWKFGVVFTDNVRRSITLQVIERVFTYPRFKVVVVAVSADVPLPGVVHGDVTARTLQQLLLRVSPAGHRHGREDTAHHPVLRHAQRQTGNTIIFFFFCFKSSICVIFLKKTLFNSGFSSGLNFVTCLLGIHCLLL